MPPSVYPTGHIPEKEHRKALNQAPGLKSRNSRTQKLPPSTQLGPILQGHVEWVHSISQMANILK